MEELNALTGGGLRISSRNDVSNKKSDANVGVVYNGMDVVNLDLYYGDHTLMAAIPELSEKVLTMDLGDGLADRIKNSPAMSRLLDENGISADAAAAYLTEDVYKRQLEGCGYGRRSRFLQRRPFHSR